MDPDPEGSYTSTSIFKSAVLTAAFTGFYIFKTGQPVVSKPISPLAIEHPAPQPAVKKPPPRSKKKIYLTFDDGPNKGTRNVLRIVEQENVPVTLFVVGEHVYGSRAQTSIYDSASRKTLFEIANHSYSHAMSNRFKKFYQLPDSVVKDFARCADSLQLKSGIARTPGRNIWNTNSIKSIDIISSTAAADSLYKHGYTIVGWDLEWYFNDSQRLVQTTEEMIAQIDSALVKNQTKTPGHLVLLAHDQVFTSPADSGSLHRFIIQLKQKDEYEFEQVSKYPGL